MDRAEPVDEPPAELFAGNLIRKAAPGALGPLASGEGERVVGAAERQAVEHDEHAARTGDVDAGRQQVDCHGDHWLGAVAELADALERAVHVGVAGNLLHEGVTLLEHVAADADATRTKAEAASARARIA